MRVLTCNIENGRAVRNNWHGISPTRLRDYFSRKRKYLKRIGAFLKKQEVDVALLQEVDGGSWFTQMEEQLPVVQIASDLMYAWYVPAHRSFGSVIHQGNATLSTYEPAAVYKEHKLPWSFEERAALEVRVDAEGTPITFINTHLCMQFLGPFSTWRHGRQLDALADIVRKNKQKTPVVVGMDANAFDYGEIRTFCMATGLRDPFPQDKKTYHTLRPRYNFDHLLVSEELGVRDARLLNGEFLSDHVPLMVDVYMR
jgi:endonuclease/exonuclease/phosphatase family metal-dependent hydrolase